MKSYHLFVDNDRFYIQDIFGLLNETRIIEPGIFYINIIDDPKCIVIKSIYKVDYLKHCLTDLLKDMGYDKEFRLIPIT